MYFITNLLLFLLISCQNHPQKLIIKSDGGSTEVRYWPLDGKQLPHYDLSEIARTNPDGTAEIKLPQNECLYRIIVGPKAFKVYARLGSIDTVYVSENSIRFVGNNKNYNDFMEDIDMSDNYSWAFRTTRNHPLSSINDLSKFNHIIDSLKQVDDVLLENGEFSKKFIEQQSLLTKMRYNELFLCKIEIMLGSDNVTKDWIEELKTKKELFSDKMATQSDWYFRGVKEYALSKALLIDKISPEKIMKSMNRFIFEAFQAELTGNNLEYALTYLLYDDIFQERYSPDIPKLYERFVKLFPNNSYIETLRPGVKKIKEMYSGTLYDGVQIIDYEKEPESFKNIISPFKGKIIYVDIWATWCKPCLEMFSHLDGLKEHTKDIHDLVFLYISLDQNANTDKWQAVANHFNLTGYHYRTKGDMDKIICSSFGNSKGVITMPRYIIVDKNGKIAFENAASPAQPDKVLQQLNSLVK